MLVEATPKASLRAWDCKGQPASYQPLSETEQTAPRSAARPLPLAPLKRVWGVLIVTIINAVRAVEPCSRRSGVEASGNPLQQRIRARNGSDRRDPTMTVPLPARLLIADAHPILVRGLEALLRANRDFDVIATCLNGVEAREKIQAVEPDLAVLDLAMPGFTGLDLLAALSRAGSRVRVILLTAAATDPQIVKAMAEGAWGLLKEATAEDLLACLRSV